MEVVTHEVSVMDPMATAHLATPQVQDILDDILEISMPGRIGVVNAAIHVLAAHEDQRALDTRHLKLIGHAHPIPIVDQEPLLEAIEMLKYPDQRQRLLEELRTIKRGFGIVPRKAFIA